jgi:hypothetical protein
MRLLQFDTSTIYLQRFSVIAAAHNEGTYHCWIKLQVNRRLTDRWGVDDSANDTLKSLPDVGALFGTNVRNRYVDIHRMPMDNFVDGASRVDFFLYCELQNGIEMNELNIG